MPDALSQNAIDALGVAVDSLLPDAPPAGLSRTRALDVRHVRPLGLGGYVGHHVAPEGALFGRRVNARLNLSINGGSEADARAHVHNLASHLLSLSRSELHAAGIHRMARADSSDARAILFDIDFEFIRPPATSEGVITDLILDIAPDG